MSRHDWGSFSLGLACRCGGLWLAVAGFERRSAARLAGAGLPFGDELLAAVSRRLEGAVSIRGHADRSGENAFFSIRIDRPHRLVRREALEIVLE